MESRKKVLVVDDEKGLLLAVRKVLEAEGYLVQTAADGQEALTAFRSFQPDAMVLDVMMPKENGYRVSRMIKTLAPHATGTKVPKIVLVTARDLGYDSEREETMKHFSMADAFLYKPFKFSDLLHEIRSLVG